MSEDCVVVVVVVVVIVVDVDEIVKIVRVFDLSFEMLKRREDSTNFREFSRKRSFRNRTRACFKLVNSSTNIECDSLERCLLLEDNIVFEDIVFVSSATWTKTETLKNGHDSVGFPRQFCLNLADNSSQVVSSLSFSPNGSYLTSGGTDGKVIVWDLSDKKPKWRFVRDWFPIAQEI